ncbi:hypothetical protein [Peptoniphilus gorbachii]|uniref:Lipoprotein n=2 Tax=Peptoniphilus TaxID=162289 RepID=A0A6N3BCC9_9FIRM|nr:hypothetical protein [Peptoniphilus harei]
MKNIKIIIISLIAILFFTACGKNKNSNENVTEKNKIEESKKEEVKEAEIKLFMARENLGESNEKFPLSEILGDLNLDDYERIFKGANFTDKEIEKKENKPGDVIISSDEREIKLAAGDKDKVFENEEINEKNSKLIESNNSLRKKALTLLLSNKLRQIETMNNPGEYKTYYPNLVKDFFEDGKLIFLASVKNANYSYQDGIFNEESGYLIPMEFQYVLNEDKNFVFDKKIEAEDGSHYGPSIEKMARGDKNTFDNLLLANINKEIYDSLMEDLFYVAKEKGLKDFTHKLEEIPGYEKDVVYIEKGPRHLDGTVEIVKKKDYEEAKKKVGKENWTYCEGILYHEKTGIAVKWTVDYFE